MWMEKMTMNHRGLASPSSPILRLTYPNGFRHLSSVAAALTLRGGHQKWCPARWASATFSKGDLGSPSDWTPCPVWCFPRADLLCWRAWLYLAAAPDPGWLLACWCISPFSMVRLETCSDPSRTPFSTTFSKICWPRPFISFSHVWVSKNAVL